jgi:hypothetical protein
VGDGVTIQLDGHCPTDLYGRCDGRFGVCNDVFRSKRYAILLDKIF